MSTILRPRALPPLLLPALLPPAAWLVVRPLLEPIPRFAPLYTSIGFSLSGLAAALYLVPALGPAFAKAGFKGRDLLKAYDTPIPECLGLVCASIYILLLILFIPVPFSQPLNKLPTHPHSAAEHFEGISVNGFPNQQLAAYLSSILALLVAALLGFLDDVFDIRWRHKLPVPIVGSIPLLMVYYAERGGTHVVVPLPLRSLFGTLVDLGPLYYVYMSLLSTFTTNSINILAGINGAEVSQALIIGLSLVLNDLLYLPWPRDFHFRVPLPSALLGSAAGVDVGGAWAAGMAHGSRELVDRHMFSLYFMLPLVAVCAGFMYHNWYPARVFPGDTFCYLAGMAFAVVGIQGHFSKTLLLFFLPQIFNFVLSCPQLFGVVPCPRHRVPRFDPATGLCHPSTALLPPSPSRLTTLVLRALAALGLTELARDPATGALRGATNLTILNFLLLRLGPMREERLVQALMCTQVAGSALAFVVRYGLAGLVYDGDRR